MNLTLTLPWPDHDLHPNARIIWQVKQGAIRTAREYAKYATQATETAMQAFSGSMTVEYTFCPPNRAHRDLDNLIANMKPSLDGIMDALQTNDNQIVKVSARWGSVVKGGSVDVVLSEQSADDKLRAELAAKDEPCIWRDNGSGYYLTKCESEFGYEDGTPGEYGAKFCPNCGHAIQIVKVN